MFAAGPASLARRRAHKGSILSLSSLLVLQISCSSIVSICPWKAGPSLANPPSSRVGFSTYSIPTAAMSATSTGAAVSSSRVLHPTEVTGSTPPDFVAPPDKEEYHVYRLLENTPQRDWIQDVDLETATTMMKRQPTPLRFLILYGSLRETSYSRLLAFEMARLLEVR